MAYMTLIDYALLLCSLFIKGDMSVYVVIITGVSVANSLLVLKYKNKG